MQGAEVCHHIRQGVFNGFFVTSNMSPAVLSLFDVSHKDEHFLMAELFRQESVGGSFMVCFQSLLLKKNQWL